MGARLYYEPPPEKVKREYIDSLRYDLGRKLEGEDYNGGYFSGKVGEEWIDFLEGIVAGNRNGDMAQEAKQLIAGIKKYGYVIVTMVS